MLFRLLLAFSILLTVPFRAPGNDPEAWNDRGIRYYQSGEFDLAIHCFSRAMDERPGDGTIRFNLASCYARLAVELVENGEANGEPSPALEAAGQAVTLQDDHAYFQKVLGFVYQDKGEYHEALSAFAVADALKPDDPATLALLGDASYRLDEKEDAMKYWRRSLAIDPGQAVLQGRMERTVRELAAEDGFGAIQRNHFRIRYDPSIEGARHVADRVIGMLEKARREVRSVVNHQTDRSVPVVLYTPERFRSYMGGHGWTRGVYDGKIRIPFEEGGIPDQSLQALATHEYVHAVIYEMSEDRCPAWLNEGLAQVLAGEWNAAAGRVARGMIAENRFISLSNLDESFLRLPADRVEQAYIESYIVVDFMLDRYTRSHLQRLVRSLSDGTGTEQAVRNIYHISTDELLQDAVEHHLSNG